MKGQEIKKIENDLEKIIGELKEEEGKEKITESLELMLADLKKSKDNLNIVDEKTWAELLSNSDSRILTSENVLVRANLTAVVVKVEKSKKEIVCDGITETEEEIMKDTARSWFTNIVDSVNKEVGDYDSSNNRIKGNNYHQRGHYFIFYEDGSKEHWMALYPKFNDSELANGHTHQAFILEFNKPVSKFVDVYTCIGCGAAGQGYTELHEHYDIDENNTSDSWETIHKNCPFEPWFTEFSTATLKDLQTSNKSQSGEEVPVSTQKYWVCPNGKLLGSEIDVWQGQEIKDSGGKTFDRAYGFIPNDGTIQWKLEISQQRIEENKKLAIDKVNDHINSLWENKEFTGYKDKCHCWQIMMNLFVRNCLKEKDYELTFKYSGGEETLKINDLLTKIADNFKELIDAEKVSRQFLEKWIKQGLANSDEIEKVKNDNEFVTLKDKPQVIKEIWIQQVNKFSEENKAEEFYLEQHKEGLTLNRAIIDINWLYKEVLNKLGENQELQAQIEVPPKN